MKDEGKLIILFAVAATLTALFFVWLEKQGHPTVVSASTDPEIAVAKAKTVQSKNAKVTAPDFDHILIRNIANVPFVELFDLIRSAPAAIRAGWIKQLEEMPAGPQQTAALMSFFKTFVQVDPHAAAEAVAGLHVKDAHSFVVDALIGAAPISAMPEMAELLIKLPPDVTQGPTRDIWRDVIHDWSAVDPAATVNYLEKHPELRERHLSMVLSNWAELDPTAAQAWLEKQPESEHRDDAVVGFVIGWYARDKASAVEYTVAHAGDGSFGGAVNWLADKIFHESPDEARAFLFRLPDEARKGAITEIVSITTGLVLGLPEDWRRQPEEVANWVLTLPRDSWGEAMSRLLGNWARPDSDGLVNWLNQLPADTRDQVVADYCSSTYLESREGAVPLALSIRDPVLRERSVRELMNHWLSDSREEALLTISESELSESEKKYLIKLLPDK